MPSTGHLRPYRLKNVTMATELLKIANALQQYLGGDEQGQYKFKRKVPQCISWVIKEPIYVSAGYHSALAAYYEKEFQEVTTKTNVEQKIAKYASLNEDWDGYGASAPTQKVIYNSINFLTSLPHNLIDQLDQDDDITPNSHGTLSFEWKFGNDKIFVEIGDDKMNMFSFIDGKYIYVNNCQMSFEGAFSKAYETINYCLA